MADMWDEQKPKQQPDEDDILKSILESIEIIEAALKLPAFRYGDKVFMTGPEWYEKFRIEFRKLAPKSYAKDFYAKKAARKAAGIKED